MTISPLINATAVANFRRTVWDYYRANRRAMHWRSEPTPYYVLVSEVMLQQTQVPRVQLKFASFIRRFPDVQSLAVAPLADVLQAWNGLGYNRRAKFLWQAARTVVDELNGEIPCSQEQLVRLPGIGANTAGAILAYAYNEPVVFIETNIRTVFIHHFFADHSGAIDDAMLREAAALVLPPENPREWYWALMDYGTHLKATVGSQLRRVKHYRPQNKFGGSRRQVRGQVIRELLDGKKLTRQELASRIPDERLPQVIDALVTEGMLTPDGNLLQLTV